MTGSLVTTLIVNFRSRTIGTGEGRPRSSEGAAAFQSEALRHHGDQARMDRKRPLEYIQDEDDQAASRGKQKKDEEP